MPTTAPPRPMTCCDRGSWSCTAIPPSRSAASAFRRRPGTNRGCPCPADPPPAAGRRSAHRDSPSTATSTARSRLGASRPPHSRSARFGSTRNEAPDANRMAPAASAAWPIDMACSLGGEQESTSPVSANPAPVSRRSSLYFGSMTVGGPSGCSAPPSLSQSAISCGIFARVTGRRLLNSDFTFLVSFGIPPDRRGERRRRPRVGEVGETAIAKLAEIHSFSRLSASRWHRCCRPSRRFFRIRSLSSPTPR